MTRKEEKRPGNPSPGRFLFQVVPPLHNLVLFRVFRQLLSVFCHEFLVVISGRDGREQLYDAKAIPELFRPLRIRLGVGRLGGCWLTIQLLVSFFFSNLFF